MTLNAEGEQIRAFVGAWWDSFAGRTVGVRELFAMANERGLDLPLGDGTERSQRTRLGKLLHALRDRRSGTLKVEEAGTLHRAQQWRLVEMSGERCEPGERSSRPSTPPPARQAGAHDVHQAQADATAHQGPVEGARHRIDASPLLRLAAAGLAAQLEAGAELFARPRRTRFAALAETVRKHRAEVLEALENPHRTAEAALRLVRAEVRGLWYLRRGSDGLVRFPMVSEAEHRLLDQAARAGRDGDLAACLRLLSEWRAAWLALIEPETARESEDGVP